MKKSIFVTLTACFISAVVFAQVKTFSYTSQTTIDFRAPAQGFMTQLARPKPGVVGSFYLYDDKYKADIFLKDSTKLADLDVKLNLNDKLVEIEYNGSVKVLPFNLTLGLILKKPGNTEEFISGDLLPGSDNRSRGTLLQVIHDGKVQLFCRPEQEIIKASANPNPMLDVGKKDDEIVLKKKYVVVHGNRTVEASVPKSSFKSSMVELFGPDAEPLIKKCNNKSEQELVELLKQLETKV